MRFFYQNSLATVSTATTTAVASSTTITTMKHQLNCRPYEVSDEQQNKTTTKQNNKTRLTTKLLKQPQYNEVITSYCMCEYLCDPCLGTRVALI